MEPRETPPACLAVFSHPSHELAVLGLVKRWRPHLLYLTDGGGGERIRETRRGLESVGALDRAQLLGYSESSFYEGLLARDVSFFRAVAERVGEVVRRVLPARVLCDAIELYNPVHDLTLPIVRAALRAVAPAPEVLEVPIIYQRPAPAGEERYEIQALPPGEDGRRVSHALDAGELAAKCAARDGIYATLRAQLGPIVEDLPEERVAREVLARAEPALPGPGGERVLRYERRGAELLARGAVARVITYRDHYLPVALSLGGA
jgi:hypothetical protein